MFEFLFVILMIGLAISSKGRKQKAQNARRTASRPMPSASAPATASPFVQFPMNEEDEEEDEAAEGEGSFAQTRGSVLQPEIHVTAHDHSGMFAGSMDADEQEGKDPCHDNLPMTEMPSHHSDRIINQSLEEPEEDMTAEAQPTLTLDWNDAGGIAKAFVMQEILKRPCDRNR